jgi:hypothetical protein
MAIELGVHCKPRPEASVVEAFTGPLMSSLLGSPPVAAWVDENTDSSWTLNWGGAASADLVLVPSGRHEFGDHWFASVAPGERGIDLSLLLCALTAVVIAVAFNGVIVDELSILGNEAATGAQALVRMLAKAG